MSEWRCGAVEKLSSHDREIIQLAISMIWMAQKLLPFSAAHITVRTCACIARSKDCSDLTSDARVSYEEDRDRTSTKSCSVDAGLEEDAYAEEIPAPMAATLIRTQLLEKFREMKLTILNPHWMDRHRYSNEDSRRSSYPLHASANAGGIAAGLSGGILVDEHRPILRASLTNTSEVGSRVRFASRLVGGKTVSSAP